MLKLYSTDWSPWVRKVRIAAIERGLEDQIELVPANIGFAEKTLKTVESDLVKYNPSGRVPTLITEDGNYIFDSTVIVHYLDEIGDSETIIPKDRDKKIYSLKINALVDEVIDSLRHITFENKKDINVRLPDWMEALDKKVRRGIAVLQEEIKNFSNKDVGILNLADIGLIILLGSIKRNPNSIYKNLSVQLDSWYDEMQNRLSVKDTNPPSL